MSSQKEFRILIVTQLADFSIGLVVDLQQSKMLIEFLKVHNPTALRVAAKAMHKAGFTKIAEADIQASLDSALFTLGRFTDTFIALPSDTAPDKSETGEDQGGAKPPVM